LQNKRKLDLVVLSDIHLGILACRAQELLQYLNSIEPKKLILNGDIIDIWQFNKTYFPKQHSEVISKIIEMSEDGTEVIYITGNHDEMLRKFSNLKIGNFTVVDKLELELDGKKAWFFHGDVFDLSIQNTKWLANFGDWGYNSLIRLNRILNWSLVKMGKKKFSLSKKINNSIKNAVKVINDFERTVSELAIDKGYKYVICGHIHQPKIIRKTNKNGTCLYLNSGDWIENLTSLEYNSKRWELNYFEKNLAIDSLPEEDLPKNRDLLTAITILGKTGLSY